MTETVVDRLVDWKPGTLMASPVLVACFVGVGIAFLLASVIRQARKSPPSLVQIPFVGDLPWFLMGFNTQSWGDWRVKQFGNIYQSWIFGERTIVVHSTEATFKVLGAEGSLVQSDWPESVKAGLGPSGITTMVGEDHARIRRILNPAFHSSILNKSLPLIVRLAQQHCHKWANQRVISGYVTSRDFPFEVMMVALLGYTEEELDEKQMAAIKAALRGWTRGLFSLPIDLPGFAYRKMLEERKWLTGQMKDHARHLLEREKSSLPFEACGETLVRVSDEDGKGLDLDQLGDVLLNLVFAGHETTASVVLTLFRELPRHPDVMQQLRAEQAKAREAHGDEITAEALLAMTYAEAVAKESLRYRNIVPFVFRRALKNLQLGPYTISKGKKLLLDMKRVVEHDPRWFGQEGDAAPSNFFPGRWLGEEGGKVGSFIPFGTGLRMCLGWRLTMLELKVLLAVWARGYEWRQVDLDDWQPNTLLRKDPQGMKIEFAPLGRVPAKKEE